MMSSFLPIFSKALSLAAFISAASLPPSHEITAGVAAIVTLFGVHLCWRAPRQQMTLEESAKDGKLTAEEAHRQIRAMRWHGPALIVAGCAALAVALLQ